MLSSQERRKHYRHEFPILIPIEYTVGPSEGEILEGFVTNISAAGLCLLTRNNMESESEIKLRDNRHIPFRTAIVQWVQAMDERHYRVGLNSHT